MSWIATEMSLREVADEAPGHGVGVRLALLRALRCSSRSTRTSSSGRCSRSCTPPRSRTCSSPCRRSAATPPVESLQATETPVRQDTEPGQGVLPDPPVRSIDVLFSATPTAAPVDRGRGIAFHA
jgi:hypothetical protein